MDVNFLSAVRSLRSLRGEPELETALSELLTKTAGEAPLTIKGVRDKFSRVNRLAKSGRVQVVKGPPGEETVIVSIKALAAIIRAAAGSLSFTDALATAGFVPTGHRLLLSESFNRDDTLVLESEGQREQRNGPSVGKINGTSSHPRRPPNGQGVNQPRQTRTQKAERMVNGHIRPERIW